MTGEWEVDCNLSTTEVTGSDHGSNFILRARFFVLEIALQTSYPEMIMMGWHWPPAEIHCFLESKYRENNSGIVIQGDVERPKRKQQPMLTKCGPESETAMLHYIAYKPQCYIAYKPQCYLHCVQAAILHCIQTALCYLHCVQVAILQYIAYKPQCYIHYTAYKTRYYITLRTGRDITLHCVQAAILHYTAYKPRYYIAYKPQCYT